MEHPFILTGIIFISVYFILALFFSFIGHLKFLFTLEREEVSFLNILYLPISGKTNVIITLLVFTLSAAFVFFHIKRLSGKNSLSSQAGTFGSARLTALKELKKDDSFEVSQNFKESSGLVLGRMDEKVISIRTRRGHNENGLLLGASGTGKTSSFIMPNLINIIRRGESFLTIDPKGELFSGIKHKLDREGYKTYVLNLKNPGLSNKFNLLADLEFTRDNLLEMSEMLFVNLGLNQESGAFFEEGARLILTFLLAVSVEFKELYEKGQLLDPPVSKNGNRVGTLGYALDLLYNYEGDETVLKNLKRINAEVLSKYKNNESGMFWRLFTPGDYSSLNEHYLANLKRVTSFFFDRKTLEMFSGDDFEIADGLREKTAYFLIMNESSTSAKNRLASVFINRLMVRYEYLKDYHRSEFPQVFRFVLDEFGAIGRINGFENVLSGCRSRDISVIFAVQDITQLRESYGNVVSSITGNCNMVLSTGVRDEPSRQFISELMGKTTVEKETVAETKDGRVSVTRIPTERSLISPDELLSVEEKIIGIVGKNRLSLKQMRYYEEEVSESASLEEFINNRRN